MEKLNIIKDLIKQNSKKRIFAENIVVEHNNYFYKSPHFSWKYFFYNWKNAYKSVKESYDIIKTYFWNDFNITKTKFYEDKELHYIIKQEKINWDLINFKKIKDIKIKDQISLLLEINKNLWKEKWLFLDILWTEALYNPFTLHNLIINNNEIYIFDFWFLDKNSSNIAFKWFSILFYYLQLFWIEKVLLKK